MILDDAPSGGLPECNGPPLVFHQIIATKRFADMLI
jgi:hypothetical protein